MTLFRQCTDIAMKCGNKPLKAAGMVVNTDVQRFIWICIVGGMTQKDTALALRCWVKWSFYKCERVVESVVAVHTSKVPES